VTPATPDFQVTSNGHVVIDIVDAGLIGDEFQMTITGPGLIIVISSDADANDGIQSDAFDGDAAWADNRLSRATIKLPTGEWNI